MTKMLDIQHLKKNFGKNEVLKDISASVDKGQVICIIGPSGSGKSTLLRSINRMNDLVPSAKVTGKIMYKDSDIYSPKTDMAELRKEIGMVFQQPNPFPFSIYENVIYGLRLKGIKDKAILDEAVEESLKAANVWDEVKDKLHSSALGLSGGQQQRVCIARVLAVNPDILLLDEPTSALDPISSGKIETMLLDLKERYTILIVTHSMQQASRISDRTAFFLNGELIEYDKTKKIFLDPKEQSTSDYVTGKFG